MSDDGEVIYTYSKCSRMEGERRWRDDDTGFEVFDSFEEAKADLLSLREDVVDDSDDIWSPMQIEKIVMLPMTRSNLLTLLNQGMEAVVLKAEIIEIIE
jgi:hypothetical protein